MRSIIRPHNKQLSWKNSNSKMKESKQGMRKAFVIALIGLSGSGKVT